MTGRYAELVLLLGLLLLCTSTSIGFAFNFLHHPEVRCIEEERQALLKFKQGLEDDYGLLSSWGSHEEDCCNWKGIKCSNRTGHVIKLDLRGDFSKAPSIDEPSYSLLIRNVPKPLSGEISSSILGLQHLTYLDLSCNNFSILPEFIGSLTKLQYLNLSYNLISGTIPQQLGNLSSLISLTLSWNFRLIENHNLDWLFHLSSLRHLDMSGVDLSRVVNWLYKVNMLPLLDLRLSECWLSTTHISGNIPQQIGNLSSLIYLNLSWNYQLANDHNLDWLFHLSSLRHLHMSGVALGTDVNWLNKVTMLPSLLELSLQSCLLSMPVPPVLSNANSFSPLSFIDLSYNFLNSSIFPWLFKYTNSLVVLSLKDNNLEGSIPKAFGNMVSLVHLDLSSNYFEGTIPQTLENLHNLQVLYLSGNRISGEVPGLSKFPLLRELHLSWNRLNGSLTKSLGKLSKLQVLDVSSNLLEGDITEAHLSNLSSLNQLDLSFNSLSILKFSPNWVPPFHLDTIALCSCKLGPAFPQWLQTQKNFSSLDMSDAGISDTIPNWFWELSSNLKFLNFSHNHIKGTIPLQWFSSGFFGTHTIDLSYNSFSGPLPKLNSDSVVLNLSNNMFQGSITSICEINGLMSYNSYLDLSNNLLSGELPNCWKNMSLLSVLNLANNNFSGRIENFFGSMCDSRDSESALRTLHLQNNSFIGELSRSLMNCPSLRLLDLGENKLNGRIPAWIGTCLPNLVVLRLPSNLFVGRMPLQLCHLTSLQILDLSRNSITGTIPKCLDNFTVMTQTQSSDVSIDNDYIFSIVANNYFISSYMDKLLVSFKGKYLEYSTTLGLVKVIDLSSNKLKGEIPREITSLSGLIGLNLSRNLLTGIIPHNIGDMERLESLDLSRNLISGVIPPRLANLTLLSYLSLSNNNLSGIIPTGTQLQSFSASTYTGNRDLCGLPLLKRCPGDETAHRPQTGSKHGEGNIQEHANSLDHLWLYGSIALGFIVGFWGVCGLLLLKSSWRHAYFRYLEKIGDWLYVTIAVSMAKLLRNFKSRCQQEKL